MGVRLSPNPSVVVAYNRLAHNQSETQAILLCREERGEETDELVRREAMASVTDTDLNHVVLPSGSQRKHARGFAAFGHRVETIHHQIHQNLLQSRPVCDDER